MAAVDKDTLLAPRAEATEEVELPGVGVVVVRGLSRGQVFAVQKVAGVHTGNPDLDVFEVEVLRHGVVEPSLSRDDVVAWRNTASASEVEAVSDAISRLSGLVPDTEKEAEASFRGG